MRNRTIATVVVCCVAGVLAFVSVSACSFLPKSDGTACGSDDDCKSKACRDGFCAGSSCKVASDCDKGWNCLYDDGIFGFGSSQRCVPTCGYCPPNFQCLASSPATASTTTCTPNASWKDPVVTIDQPAHDEAGSHVVLRVGEPVTFHATATSPAGNGIASFAWMVDEKSAEGDTPTFTFGPSDVNGNAQANVTVTDSAGNKATQTLPITICAGAGISCTPGTFGLCCQGFTCKATTTGGTAGACTAD